MHKFLIKKIDRLFRSKKILKLFFIFHKVFGENYLGKINFDFSKKKNRSEIIQHFIKLKNFKSYLEIGTFDNQLFNKIICEKKVGVDPVSGGTIRMTSDAFFKINQEKFDIIFIDGLHTYKQVKKDIFNSLNVLNSGGIILLHDCLPNDYYAHAVPRCMHAWNGDVWRAFVEVRTKENLDSYCVNADYGVGIVLKRENKNLLKENIKDFSKIKFNYYFKNYKFLMNLKEFEEIKNII